MPPSPEPKSTPAGARLLWSSPAATLALVLVETFCGLGGGSIFLISGFTRAISWVSLSRTSREKSIRGIASTDSGVDLLEIRSPMNQKSPMVEERARTNEMGSRKADKVVCPRSFARRHGHFPEPGREPYDPRA